jgi:hypothetical protein
MLYNQKIESVTSNSLKTMEIKKLERSGITLL